MIQPGREAKRKRTCSAKYRMLSPQHQFWPCRACERSSNYIVGKSITNETDHKPLVSLIMKHTIDKLRPRLQRYEVRLMRFHIRNVQHVYHYAADTLSRKLANLNRAMLTIADEMQAHIDSVIAALLASALLAKLSEISKAQDQEECVSKWRNIVQSSGSIRTISNTIQNRTTKQVAN